MPRHDELLRLLNLLKNFIDASKPDELLNRTYIFIQELVDEYILKHNFKYNSLSLAKSNQAESNQNCMICHSEASSDQDDFFTFGCQHSCHIECFSRGIKSFLSQEKPESIGICFHAGCNYKLTPNELAIFVDSPDDIIAIQRIFIRHLGFKFCPSCDHSLARQNEYLGFASNCPVCESELCFSCGKDPHHGISCEEALKSTRTMQAIFDLVTSIIFGDQSKNYDDDFGLCPNCVTLLEKKDGCDSMVCGQNAVDKEQLGAINAISCGKKFSWGKRIRLLDFQKEPKRYWDLAQHAVVSKAVLDTTALDPGGRLNREQFVQLHLDGVRNFVRVDLRGVDLSGIDFTEVDLRFANLAMSSLNDYQVTQLYANGRRDFNRVNIISTYPSVVINFLGADLRGIGLRGTNLNGADFSGANLLDADIYGANISNIIINQETVAPRSCFFMYAKFKSITQRQFRQIYQQDGAARCYEFIRRGIRS